MASKLTSLDGRVAIITGAGGGLGREYALLLAAYGARVVVNDYGGSLSGERGTVSRAQGVVDEIKATGGEAIADGHDISIQEEVKALVQATLDSYGTVDILVNNAGTAGSISSHDNVNVASFRRTWEIAALGTIMLISAVYPTMEKNGYGRIITTGSDSLFGMGAGGDGGYTSSKGAVFGLTRDIGRMSPKHGIKINGVMPSAASRMSDLSEVIKRITRQFYKPHLVADFVVALASEQCPVSGELFSVGGGRAARVVIATVPGHVGESSPEGYLANWDKVMGSSVDVYIPTDTIDVVSYAIKQATGLHQLRGRNAVITGGAAGLGASLGFEAASLGMRVIVVDIDVEAAQQTVSQITRSGGAADYIKTDVSVAAEVDKLAESVYQKHGSVSLLINNAGIETLGLPWDIPPERWAATINVNIQGVVSSVRAFLPRMIASGEESWVANVGSVGAIGVVPAQTAYIMTKAAVQAFTEGLFAEMQLQHSPIHISLVLPGLLRTGIFRHNRDSHRTGQSQLQTYRKYLSQLADTNGMDVGEASKLIMEQVVSGKFWITTHPETLDDFVCKRVQCLQEKGSPMSMMPKSSTLFDF
ncbi:unnamed protein product [Clonostachys chloroleuca]|uniref:Uncharacterized protein n=1 Tax=Clonostachys chloroleuca TaxID=1926264 RepID=A0AA35MFF8_9HYPO|nr:unnamed protein product [Clonostachys chloroleuca]